ncbi:MAG: class I SAM-dependent methyltransferase [Nitrospirota bacterium]
MKSLNLYKDAQILDAGCGGGYIMNELYKMGFENVWGFDASETGIALAQSSYAVLKDRIAVHNVYDAVMPSHFPPGGYDLVLSIEVIEHMYSPRDYLKNARYWLKDSGHLILSTPYNGYLKNLVISLLNKYDQHHNPLWDGGHIKFFSVNSLYLLLEEIGFKPIRFQGSGRLPFVWKSMLVASEKK